MHEPFPANSLPSDDELQNAFIGKNNTSYYRIAFARMQEYGSLASGWNWVAFFFTSWWLIYRRLWGIWFIYQATWFGFIATITVLRMSGFSSASWAATAGVMAMFLVPGWRANAWYYNRALGEIVRTWDAFRHDRHPREAMLAAAANSGTASALQIIGFLGGILFFALLTALIFRTPT